MYKNVYLKFSSIFTTLGPAPLPQTKKIENFKINTG